MNLIHLGDLINSYKMDQKKFLKISLENFVLHKNVVSFSFPTLLLTPFSLYLSPYFFPPTTTSQLPISTTVT